MAYPNPTLLAEVRAYLAMADPALASKLARYTKTVLTFKGYHGTDIASGSADIITIGVSEGEAYLLPILRITTRAKQNIEGDKIQIVNKAGATIASPQYVKRTGDDDQANTEDIRLDFILPPVDEYKVQYIGEGALSAAHLTVQLIGWRITTPV